MAFIQSNYGNFIVNFVAIILGTSNLVHHALGSQWVKGGLFDSFVVGPASLIQSNYGSGDHGNFEVVVLEEGGILAHWWRDNSPGPDDYQWNRSPIPISTNATGPGCIIQSNYGSGDHGNFEVVVLEGSDLTHYWRDNSPGPGDYQWHRSGVITSTATGPGCIIQSDYGSGGNGNFEVVVVEEQSFLAHWWRDNSPGPGDYQWHRSTNISFNATGPGSIIQSDYKSGDHGNFEVIVQEKGGVLAHWWRDNSPGPGDYQWHRSGEITSNATGPGSIIQGGYGSGDHHSFEVVVLETGGVLAHWYRDNSPSPGDYQWHRTTGIECSAIGPGSIIQSDYGHLEVVVPEEGGILAEWWRDDSLSPLPDPCQGSTGGMVKG